MCSLAGSGWKCNQWTEPTAGGIPTVGEFVGLQDVWPLLPLPMPTLIKWKKHKSCRLRQRLKSKLQIQRAATSVINLINALHTGRVSTKLTTPDAGERGRMKVTAARQLALSHVLKRVALEVRARRGFNLTGVQPLASLLKASLDESGYVRPATVRQVAMVADRIVEPADEGFINMLDALPAEDAAYYADEANVVETGGKCSVLFEEIEAHYGFIGGELDEFLRYLRRPDVGHLWQWDLMSNIKAIAGVSVVLKKNGIDQRKLIMQCAANYMFGDPSARAHLGMGGGASLARVFVAGDSMQVSACDEDSAFSYVKVPDWMAQWQAAPPMPAVQAWDLLPMELKKSIDNKYTTMVAPKYLRLAMGGSHSVYILMRMNLQHIGKTLFNYASRLKPEIPDSPGPGLDDDVNGRVLELEDEDVELPDEEWVEQQSRRSQHSRAVRGWTVDEWCEEVRRTKHHDARTLVVIHMFAGERRKEDVQHYLEELMDQHDLRLLMISVDLAMDENWDFSNPVTYSKIMGLAEEGLIDIFFGGPPCSTVARSRFVHIPGGPRPLRFRWALWGRADLYPAERLRVEEANMLWLNFMSVAEAVASRGGAYLWEHPADPGCSPYPSVWITDEMTGFEARVGGRRVHLHQCPFGGIAPKLTTLSGNLDDMEAVDGVRCPGLSEHHQHGISIGRKPGGGYYTRQLQTYPPRLCEALAKMIFATLLRFSVTLRGPTGALNGGVAVAAPRITSWSTGGKDKFAGVALLNEASARGFSTLVTSQQSATYVHVDDAVFVSASDATSLHSDKLLDLTVGGLESIGFKVTQQFRSGSLDKVVGYEVVSCPAEFRLPVKKMVLLRASLNLISHARLVDVDVLHSLLGMWIFGALLRRELLSIPQVIFRFIEEKAGLVTTWWPAARDEARAMAVAVPLMVCHVGSPILPWLFSTDAMGANVTDHGGYGIAVTEITEFEVDCLLKQGEMLGRSIARLDGNQGAKYPHRALVPTVPYTLLPEQLFWADRWNAVEHGRWRFGDHITIGESRAVLKMLRRVSAWAGLQGKAVFTLQDNMPTASSMMKGRSPSFALNRILRMKAATCLAGRLRAYLPWVESARQPADELSRLQ